MKYNVGFFIAEKMRGRENAENNTCQRNSFSLFLSDKILFNQISFQPQQFRFSYFGIVPRCNQTVVSKL